MRKESLVDAFAYISLFVVTLVIGAIILSPVAALFKPYDRSVYSPSSRFECAVLMPITEELEYLDSVYSFRTGKDINMYYAEFTFKYDAPIKIYSTKEISLTCYTD